MHPEVFSYYFLCFLAHFTGQWHRSKSITLVSCFLHFETRKAASLSTSKTYRGFQTRMVYLDYITCLRYTILVRNPRYAHLASLHLYSATFSLIFFFLKRCTPKICKQTFLNCVRKRVKHAIGDAVHHGCIGDE